jgi:transcriptional regulator with XRE-family HTH domain
MGIGDQLRQAIERSGKSRYRISQESGVSQSVLSRLVSGERGISTTTVDALLAALELKVVLKPKPTRKPKTKRNQ